MHSILMECIHVARPSFLIVPDRLKQLRQDAGLTQLALAKKVHAQLNKSEYTSDATLVSDYQRIERTGRTSSSTATALATILNTSVATLQGGDPTECPEDFIALIEKQLRHVMASGTNDAFAQRFPKVVGEGDDLHYLAKGIAAEIEAAQIGASRTELTKLSALVGWSDEKLQKLAYVRGYWFVQTVVLGHRETAVVLGSFDVLEHIRRTVAEWPRNDEPGSSIVLERSFPWYHVELRHPAHATPTHRFSFIRCEPTVDGLKWRNPTWTDQEWIEKPLLEWAQVTVNRYTDFDGQLRPREVGGLRLSVVASDTRQVATRRRAIICRELDEFYEGILQRHAGREDHEFLLNWLLNDLWDGLQSHMQTLPSNAWQATVWGTAVKVGLKGFISTDHYVRTGFIPDTFLVRLIEEQPDSSYRSVPWSTASMDAFASGLNKRLEEGYGADAGSVRLTFSPFDDAAEAKD